MLIEFADVAFTSHCQTWAQHRHATTIYSIHHLNWCSSHCSLHGITLEIIIQHFFSPPPLAHNTLATSPLLYITLNDRSIRSRQSFCSPTDNMMSPCTQKLVLSKKRHYSKYAMLTVLLFVLYGIQNLTHFITVNNRGKPLTLSSAFQQSAASSSAPAKSSLAQSQEDIQPDTTME
jgi:hypothetical protein